MAEEVGFEPTVPRGTTVFKTAAFNHSATPPRKGRMKFNTDGQLRWEPVQDALLCIKMS